MLGGRILTTAISAELDVVPLGRDFADFSCESVDELHLKFADMGASPGDYLVNCIGWIPQKGSGETLVDATNAVLANVVVPAKLKMVSVSIGMTVIQIATDCIFSGRTGHYKEDSLPDANDLYGRSKILGEFVGHDQITIRCSIVGLSQGGSGLLNWLMSQSHEAQIDGYSNHYWNGVSTNAFANLVVGIVRNGYEMETIQHWIPKDFVSKYQLLMLAKHHSGRHDISIRESASNVAKDMRLSTASSSRNVKLWKLAGYETVPSIDELIAEIFESGEG